MSVFERKSGRILTGVSAPTTLNLKKWLQDNPTFEVVQPGSSQALDIEVIVLIYFNFLLTYYHYCYKIEETEAAIVANYFGTYHIASSLKIIYNVCTKT